MSTHHGTLRCIRQTAGTPVVRSSLGCSRVQPFGVPRQGFGVLGCYDRSIGSRRDRETRGLDKVEVGSLTRSWWTGREGFKVWMSLILSHFINNNKTR